MFISLESLYIDDRKSIRLIREVIHGPIHPRHSPQYFNVLIFQTTIEPANNIAGKISVCQLKTESLVNCGNSKLSYKQNKLMRGTKRTTICMTPA